MTEEICIKSSGLTLASLLCENAQSMTDQYGFLMGYASEEVVKSVTDAEMETINIKRILNIIGIFPISDNFFDHIGEVDYKNKIIEYIRDEKNVIGWYRSRKNTSLKMTLREKLIHKELCSIIDTPELFTFCGLTSSYSKNNATHTYSQIFYRYDYVQFIELPLIITNLGDANKLYKTTSQRPGTIDKIIQSIRSDVNLGPDLNLNKIELAVQQYMYTLIDQVTKLYTEKQNIEHEIQQLEEQKSNSERYPSESDDSLKEILTKTSDDLQDKLNFANAVKNKSTIVNKETKKALNVQLKMVPDSSSTITKEVIKNKSKIKNTPSSSNVVERKTRSNKQHQQNNNSKELNNSTGILQDNED